MACNCDLYFSFDNLRERVERGSVFAESLCNIEGEHGDIAFFSFQDDATDDGSLLVSDEIENRESGGGGDVLLCLGVRWGGRIQFVPFVRTSLINGRWLKPYLGG